MEPPVPQLSIDVAPAGLPVYLGHDVHWDIAVAPTTLDHVPAGQRAHTLPEEYVPGGHLVPVFMHANAEVDIGADVVPSGQAVHNREFGAAEYVLIGQAVHAELSLTMYPGLQYKVGDIAPELAQAVAPKT